MENQTSETSILIRILRLIPLLALAVAIVSLLLSVASRKKELTCEFTGSTRLVAVSASGVPADVRMEYHGEPVQSLTKLSFLLRNTGAAAIKLEDVRDAARLSFPRSVQVLSAVAERTSPQSFDFSPKVTDGFHDVELNFQLLNSGDEAAFSVYIINSDAAMPRFVGRIVDVPRLVFVSNAGTESPGGSQVPKNHAVRNILHGSLVIVHSLIALVVILLAGVGVVSYIELRTWRRKWGAKFDQVVQEETRKLEDKKKREDALEIAGNKVYRAHDGETLTESALKSVREGHTYMFNVQLKEANIPIQPRAPVETLGGVITMLVGLSGIAALFVFTAYLAHLSLRG